jgi:hypothetical protein
MTIEHSVELVSTIKCPHCGGEKEEQMPTDACQFFYECTHCGEMLRPLSGDCCVFCSYGTVMCPSMQTGPTQADCCRPREP